MRSDSGKPCSASRTAGARTFLKVILPKRSSSFAQPSTAPGTVAESTPVYGSSSSYLLRKYERVHAPGAQPEALSPYSLPSPAM